MMRVEDLISKSYRAQQRELHARPQGYGGKGKKWAETVLALAQRFDAGSVLDYGCGTGTLAERLREMPGHHLRVAEYDPAIAGKDGPPAFADLVVCTDVLEHIEPERLSLVLRHLHALARKAVFFVVALDEANKTLLDGRNAHLILEPPGWWATQVAEAGFDPVPLDDLPMPVQYSPAKRSKRWIAIGVPRTHPGVGGC